jgi:hypothetical protein
MRGSDQGGSTTLSVTDRCQYGGGDGAFSHVGNRTWWSILLTSEKFTQIKEATMKRRICQI